jgi:hypothetical protein
MQNGSMKCATQTACGIDDFNHVNDMAYAMAKASVEKAETVGPAILAVKITGPKAYALTIIDVSSIDAAQRERVMWLQDGLCRNGHADIAAFMSEAWVVQAEGTGEACLNVRPSEHAARKECVVASLMSKECQMLSYHLIDRDGCRLIKGELDASIKLAGRLARATPLSH